MYEIGTVLKERNTKPAVVRPIAIGQRSETVRRANLSAIVRELHLHGPRSRSTLVARTGLTRSAIRALIGELVAAGLASEERAAPLGTPGRPSPLVRLDPEGAVVLALEIAVDSLAVAVVGLGGEVLDLVRVDRPRGHLSVDETVADLVALIERVTGGSTRRQALIAIGVAVVGVVRRTDGFVSMAPNLGWRDVPLGARLAEALDVSVPILVANEADLGALAELRRGAAMGRDHLLFISGEVNPTGVACRCGSVGCWETEVGAGALLSRAGHPADGGRDELDAVIREAERGEPAALSALESVGRWLGFGLAGLVNVLNPGLIVLGGLFGRIHPFVGETIDLELDRLALPAPRKLVGVFPARLGVDAPLLGAAELAFDAFLADPAVRIRPRRAEGLLASA